jgi:hypothetical protein
MLQFYLRELGYLKADALDEKAMRRALWAKSMRVAKPVE